MERTPVNMAYLDKDTTKVSDMVREKSMNAKAKEE
jgi:hypothetical protein